jgi:lipopolysaccharide cholinephosphotransferase
MVQGFQIDDHNDQPIRLSEQKKIMLNLLGKFIEYCENHNLRYYLAAGTLLGAVRHRGFIPWDDDIDIVMPKKDYDRLIYMCRNDPLSDGIIVSSLDNNPKHIWPMAKVIDSSTYLVEPNVRKKYIHKQSHFGGIYIDIFPMYGLPIEADKRKRFCKQLFNTYKSYMRSIRIVKRTPGLKNNIHYILSTIFHIPFRLISPEYYLMKISNLVSKYPLESSSHYGFAMGMVSYPKDVNPCDYLEHEIELQFEYLRCKSIRQFNDILLQQYGDYMKLPPENERKTHPRIVYRRV